MADYHRFVAYIYEYVNGRKGRNAGFAKIESRNGICRIQIHIQNLMPVEGKIEVFGFVREKETLPAVLLNEGESQGSGFDSRITTPEEPFGGSRYRFEQVCGIWIRSESGRNWVTIFDDEPVEIERLGKTGQEERERGHMEEAERETKIDELEREDGQTGAESQLKTVNQDVKKRDETENKRENKNAKSREALQSYVGENKTTLQSDTEQNRESERPYEEGNRTILGPDREQNGESERSYEEENRTILQSDREQNGESGQPYVEIGRKMSQSDMEAKEEVLRENRAQNREMKQTHVEKNRKIPRSDVQQNEEIAGTNREEDKEPPRAEAEKNGAVQSNVVLNEGKKTEGNCADCEPRTDKRWNCATARYPHFQPVSDGSIADAIRIQPSDLRTLWQKGWRQGSNSFLMHGFYQYHYIMLGKCREGGYVLGVPGIRSEQEEYMARMFGFPDFRPANQQQEGHTFGYWCRKME